MFEGFLEKFLLKYLGEYLKGIDKSNLSVAVWKGEISVKTVDLNPLFLKKLGLPLTMTYGRVDSLLMRVPWKDLSSKPVEIVIESICMVACLEDINFWYSQKSYVDFCNALIEGVKDDMMKKLEEEFDKTEKKTSFFEQIFDNLLISVKNIQIRIESNLPNQRYTFGGILEDFSLKSVDSRGNPVFVKRTSTHDKVTKLISFKNLILYHDGRTLCEMSPQVCRQYFEIRHTDYHRILNLNLDVLFTLSPYPRDGAIGAGGREGAAVSPVYELSTEIGAVEVVFDTLVIKDLTDLLDYFGHYKQSKFDYLEKQKYNHLKPKIHISDVKNAKIDQKSKIIKSWWKFALLATKLKRRSKLCGIVLAEKIGQKDKGKWREELIKLLILKIDGKLPKDSDSTLSWLIQVFTEKELTDIMKRVSYETYKNTVISKKKDKSKIGLNLEDIVFFSLDELPEGFNYLEVKAMVVDSTLRIRSDDLVLSLTSSNTGLEYKQNNTGNETIINIGGVISTVDNTKLKTRDVVCLGHPSGHDLVNLYFKSKRNSRMVFGRIRRIYLYYKPDLFTLIHSFISTFEDSLNLSSKLSNKTHALIQGNNTFIGLGQGGNGQGGKMEGEDNTMDDVINVKIEAPILIIPQDRNMWVVDLGTFDISKAGKEQNKNKETILEGKDTKVFYGNIGHDILPNLNAMENKNTVVEELVEKMDLVVSDLEFAVRLFKKRQEISPGVFIEISAVDLLCEPLTVDFIPKGSLDSFFKLLHTFSRDSSGESLRVDSLLSRADYTNHETIEYNHGYENWERVYCIVEGQSLHLVSPNKKILSHCPILSVTSTQILHSQEEMKVLILQTFVKKIELRSCDLTTLTELQYNIETVIGHFKEEGKINTEENTGSVQTPAMPTSSTCLTMQFRQLHLSLADYHSQGIPFILELDETVYNREVVNGKENGVLMIGRGVVINGGNRDNILTLQNDTEPTAPSSPVSPSRRPKPKTLSSSLDSPLQPRSPTLSKLAPPPVCPKNPALRYSYTYTEGSIESVVQIGKLHSVYKVNYIRSMLYLTGFIIESSVLKDHPDSPIPNIHPLSPTAHPPAPSPPSTDNTQPVKISTLKSSSKIEIRETTLELYYKEDLHTVDVMTKVISISILSHGIQQTVSGVVTGAGIYDLHPYPFKKGQSGMGNYKTSSARSALLKFTPNGQCTFAVHTDSTGTTTNTCQIQGIQIYWIQQQAMRLIDFLMFQVLEVFYPSLHSFSSHYTRENIVKFALTVLNDPNFLRHNITIKDGEIRLVSTTEPTEDIRLIIPVVTVHNNRYLLPKTLNKSSLQYFPFQELESDRWDIDVQNVKIGIGEKSGYIGSLSDEFNFKMQVDLLKKLFELSFLYNVVEDVENMPKEMKGRFESGPQVYPEVVRVKSSTVDSSGQMVRAQTQAFLSMSNENKETLYVNGRYNLQIWMDKANIVLSNRFINRLYQILGNNINFDDGMDPYMRNAYTESTTAIQVYTLINIHSFEAKVPDSRHPELEVFRLGVSEFKMEVNKRSDYVNIMEFCAQEFEAYLGTCTGMPAMYQKFIDQSCFKERGVLPTASGLGTAIQGSVLTQTAPQSESQKLKTPYDDFLSLSLDSNFPSPPQNPSPLSHIPLSSSFPAHPYPFVNKSLPVWGSIKMTPDMKKDIEITFDRTRILAFRFLLRLLPELLHLGPVVEHPGFEDSAGSKISILIKVESAELCIPSGEDRCLVLTCSLTHSNHRPLELPYQHRPEEQSPFDIPGECRYIRLSRERISPIEY